MAKQKSEGRKWYVLHTYSGYEDAVKEALKQRIESMNMQDYIFDVIVPKEIEIEVKKGEPRQIQKRMFPGYVMVNMIVTDESWYVVRNTPNVTGFIGAGVVPIPVSDDEMKNIRKRMGVAEPKYKADFVLHENVAVTDGPFAGYQGLVSEIDETKGKLKVLVALFGRETPVELDFNQVKKT